MCDRQISAPGNSSKKLSKPITVRSKMPVSQDAEHYNMSHTNRGKCVVFNQEKFESKKFSKREGSSKDVKRIRTTFGKLGFDVTAHTDWERSKIEKEIRKLSNADHSENDCICIFVLTHGSAKGELEAHDGSYNSKTIWEPFTADKCLTLAGKPKLFFFQACRGVAVDTPVNLDYNLRKKLSRMTMQPTVNSKSNGAAYTIPSCADILMAHSSVEEFSSARNIESGTWFVQSLCDVLDEHADRQDLLKMLTSTARKVATEFESLCSSFGRITPVKQVPSFTSSLTRELYFTPKKSLLPRF